MTAIVRSVRDWLLALAVLCAVAWPACALDFGRGPLPVSFEPGSPVSLGTNGRIDIAGTIEGTAPVTLVLRVDDGKSSDYQSRMNDERSVPAGPFALSFDVAALSASNGRKLDSNDIRRVILFIVGPGTGQIWHFAHTASAPSAPQVAAPSTSRVLGLGALPIKFTAAPVLFSDRDEIRIEGVNADTAPAAVALRIDDKASSSYQTRYNDERMVPPGKFQFSVGLKGLKTISGRSLEPATITQIILFPWKDKPNVTITRFEAVPAPTLPEGARGYAFGALDAALPAGFERVGPTDQRVTGRGPVTAFRRPAPDPLIANGVKGIQLVKLAAPAKRVRVTVWSEDPGAWDLLPHPFVRRIQINGRDAVNERWTADDWIARRYLAGASIEHTAKDDAWTAYGSLRGKPASVDVDAGRDGIVIEVSGADMSAYVLNAVLIEPIGASTPPATTPTAAQTFVTEKRAEWYRNTFPVSPAPASDDGVTRIGMTFTTGPRLQIPPLKSVAAADTGVALPFEFTAGLGTDKPRITITAPEFGSAKLTTRLWAAQWRLQRHDSILQLKNDRLMADTASLPITKEAPRGYELWIDVPKGVPPGLYKGKIEVASQIVTQTIPLEITVPNVQLPPAAKPAGFYLARAPHLAYFVGLTIEREKQVDCDLDLLRGFGLTNTAPPIDGLNKTDLGSFATDMRRASAHGVAPGFLIYNPLNALVETQGQARAAETVGRLEELIKAQAMPEPLWSVADEPSNADQGEGSLEEWVRLLRAKAPGIRLAGHLNNPSDKRFLPLFDTAIVNDGYGIDIASLEQLATVGKGPWLYNTFAPRQTAGLWLWRTAAKRYVQWHARMPTADPFDPADGREADFQMIYPTAHVCPRQPDIHRDLLRMAEGVVDQRWLLWLDKQTSPEAAKLRDELRATYAGPFEAVKSLTRAQLEAIRARIIALAVK